MHDYWAFDDLGEAIDDDDGIYVAKMGELRDAHGVKKLGVHVGMAISDELKRRGIGTLPAVLPLYQEAEVRLYRLGTTTAKVIDAVLSPSDVGDRALRETTGTDSQAVLKQIRELVCE